MLVHALERINEKGGPAKWKCSFCEKEGTTSEMLKEPCLNYDQKRALLEALDDTLGEIEK